LVDSRFSIGIRRLFRSTGRPILRNAADQRASRADTGGYKGEGFE
jgi:hypothetical protein